jgi:hypothetical protein
MKWGANNETVSLIVQDSVAHSRPIQIGHLDVGARSMFSPTVHSITPFNNFRPEMAMTLRAST